jgi:surface antigen
MRTTQFIALVLTTTMLAACQQGGPGMMNGGSGLNKQDVGMLGGAIGGGVIGSTMGRGAGKTAATLGGALLGGLVGSEIGKSLDNADRAAMNSGTQHALESSHDGQSLPWKNAQSGNSGTITPTNNYQNSNGQYCREFTQTINVGGQSQKGYGTACRQPDGSWQVVSQQ